ncbi:hypothetical protein OB955_05600 [Halobacteria archaeon AArc-m2/3/4]|uniref:Uncharacterized protein n=1 Tax=Natronoglomus mannanivorans TaxID=2979990 RepID=A0AAP3E3K6_9EURY|nr:hypothetical protein [Halobacteria archaeon AArc-xg1-1]MCU4972208.1 hypothetical protein [Halobacteria archaeon AArc-m2/3/4]
MFERRPLSEPVEAVRAAHAPDAVVLDCERDFETLPPSQAEALGVVVDALEPSSAPTAWLPDDAPELLRRYASDDFTVGMPGDGSIAWTHQTVPPTVIVKPRIGGSPEPFVDFLLAEALVEIGLEVPEHFLGFFEDEYREFDRVVPLDPNGTYQVAAALYDGWVGLQTRAVFAGWVSEASEASESPEASEAESEIESDPATGAPSTQSRPELAAAWRDAGNRLEERVSELPSAVARGETDFADATELACAAIKHGIELPAPFAALETEAYLDHGPAYAIRWAEKTFDALGE